MKKNGYNQSCPIVDIHASWLALNPIHGCVNNCKYCFLKKYNIRGIMPNQLVDPEEAYNILINYNFYKETFPLCLFTSTDIFATKPNIDYCLELLEIFCKHQLKNTIIFITKCYIPMYFIEKVKYYQSKGLKFLFMLSYSGLDNSIEVGINKTNIEKNFVNLFDNKLTIVHYWRPFIPQNSTKKILNNVLDFVKQYSSCSVAIGLKVYDNTQIDLWPQLNKYINDIKSKESVWTKNAYDIVYNYNGNYPIFKTTSCAISYAQNLPDYCGFYKTNDCIKNNCPKAQREKCLNNHRKLIIKDIEKNLNYCLKKLNIHCGKELDFENRIIKLNTMLTTSEAVYIKMMTNCTLKYKANLDDYYWNSTNNSDGILII